ncbi:hypothetical protein RIVM261_012500 [Rivularia sp. IAM M-261]|nr:hypothetical protein CAL7716_071570 [Calothrix sp. PCC 7716]GJD16294.1 hypothetical protein RIVM261_012500 [Rivularia sp. IAM M-261]
MNGTNRQVFSQYVLYCSPSEASSIKKTMLKSYEAIFEDGQVKWLTDEPQVYSARVIVTILVDGELAQHGKSFLKK